MQAEVSGGSPTADRPDVMSIFTTRIIMILVIPCFSRMKQSTNNQMEDGRWEAVWQDPFLKPCYLFALVGGDLAVECDKFVTLSGREIDLRTC